MSDPIDIKKQIEDNQYRRYVISVNSGQESLVIDHLIERVKKKQMGTEIIDYLNPIVREVLYKKGEKVIKERKLYPGYVFVKSKMNEKVWYIIRNTPGVRLIVGAEIRPIPLSEKEYQDMVDYIQEKNARAEFAVPFQEGDVVELKDGDFNGMKWVITEIDVAKWMVYVNVEILWRNTPVMLTFDKVERVS